MDNYLYQLNNHTDIKDKNLPLKVDDIIGRILNQDGIYQIGHKVIKIGYSKGKETTESSYKQNGFAKESKEFDVKIMNLSEKKARPNDFVGNYNLYYTVSDINVDVEQWNQMFGYYIGLGWSVTCSSAVDFVRIYPSVAYKKSGLFGHGWRDVYGIQYGSSTYVGGTVASAATFPSFFNRYVVQGSFLVTINTFDNVYFSQTIGM
jgi:hypothetical protein